MAESFYSQVIQKDKFSYKDVKKIYEIILLFLHFNFQIV